jgi:hypothetical protein
LYNPNPENPVCFDRRPVWAFDVQPAVRHGAILKFLQFWSYNLCPLMVGMSHFQTQVSILRAFDGLWKRLKAAGLTVASN